MLGILPMPIVDVFSGYQHLLSGQAEGQRQIAYYVHLISVYDTCPIRLIAFFLPLPKLSPYYRKTVIASSAPFVSTKLRPMTPPLSFTKAV